MGYVFITIVILATLFAIYIEKKHKASQKQSNNITKETVNSAIKDDTFSYLETKQKPCYAKTIIVTAIFIAFFIIISTRLPITTTDDHYPNGDTIVRITQTGSKYHFSFCSYLNSSSIKITLEKASSRGYSSCSRCDPPSYISVEEYKHAKETQSYILNIFLAMISSIPTAILAYFVALIPGLLISHFLSLSDNLPYWTVPVSALVTYVIVFIREIKEFIIW